MSGNDFSKEHDFWSGSKQDIYGLVLKMLRKNDGKTVKVFIFQKKEFQDRTYLEKKYEKYI